MEKITLVRIMLCTKCNDCKKMINSGYIAIPKPGRYKCILEGNLKELGWMLPDCDPCDDYYDGRVYISLATSYHDGVLDTSEGYLKLLFRFEDKTTTNN